MKAMHLCIYGNNKIIYHKDIISTFLLNI